VKKRSCEILTMDYLQRWKMRASEGNQPQGKVWGSKAWGEGNRVKIEVTKKNNLKNKKQKKPAISKKVQKNNFSGHNIEDGYHK